LVVCIRGLELSSETQGRNHSATGNVEIIGITIELDGRSESTIWM
jgi:hypothetical protein